MDRTGSKAEVFQVRDGDHAVVNGGSTHVRVALVIPVHNRRETTLQCLRSLSRIDRGELNVRIFVVDDGSTDGTADAIRNEFSEVSVIAGDGTLHYAAGTNRGISAALEWNAEYIVTMNDDSVFHEQFLRRLVNTSETNGGAIVGSLLCLWNEPHRVFQVAPKWQTLAGGWNIPHDLTAFTVPKEPFAVESIVGNCVLFPVRAIRENGLMDERSFPHGWGDAQYVQRHRKAGWHLLIDPRSLVFCEPNTYPPPLHDGSPSETLRILVKDRRHPANLHRQFVARWHSAPSRPKALIAFAVYILTILGKTIEFGVNGGKGAKPRLGPMR